MRRLLALGLASIAAGAGCSLVVSTSDLTGGPAPDSGTDTGTTPPPVEGGATLVDAADAASTADVEVGPAADPSLLGAWSFDDGTTADTSGNGHDGHLSGDATITGSSYGKSLQLQGAGSMEIASLSAVLFPPTGTYAVRFKWSSMTVDIEDGILDEWEGGRDHLYLRHANGADPGTMQVAFQKADKDYLYATGFDAPKDTWQHVAITWDTTNRKGAVYAQGKLVEPPGTWEGSWTPIDQHMTFGLNLHGLIDDVRLYDRVLSGAEITALAKAQ